jgi:uridine kinase
MASSSDALAPLPRPQRLAALRACPLLAELQAADVEALLDATDVLELPPGATVVREGEASGDMYFVLQGEARLRRNDLGLKSLGPGGHFGALGLLTGQKRTVTVIAVAPLLLARLTPARWGELEAVHPQLALALVRGVLLHTRDELVEMTDRVGLLLHGRSLPRAREVTVTVDGEARRVATGTPVAALLPSAVDGALVVAGLLNQKPVSLHTPLFSDARVAPLTVADSEGRQVWVRSLGLVLLEAARQVAPELSVRIGPSLGPVQVVEVRGAPRADLTRVAERLAGAMERIVAADAPIRQELWAIEEAHLHFRERGWDDAAQLLATQRVAGARLVTCGGLYALGMGTFLPSTGALRGWSLVPHGDGLLLDYGRNDPRSGNGVAAALAPVQETGMAAAHLAWLAGMGVTSVGAFNGLCVTGGVAQLIRVAEGFHEKRIGAIADDIAARHDRVRVIAIAGPSSSGKTTFIKRLTTQLHIDGLRPIGLSLDDYYVDRERTVRDEKGEYDFEALEALNLPLLQSQVRRLLAGETVATAKYDFVSGKSRPEGGPRIHLGPGEVLMIEGIHGLNPRLLEDITRPGELYRIFIQPSTTLPFDRLSRVSATDVRLLRRIVRDRHQRGYRAEENILRWPSVQRGEQRHIFPFQGEADATFDSSLIYEPSVLKVYAERYLLEVPQSSSAYATAWRLRLLIDRFVSIYPDHVPPTSILREFIGGSGFEY